MPAVLDALHKKIWSRLKGKTNPRTKKLYTESEAWAIATAQFKKSNKNLSVCVDNDFESESDILMNAIRDMEDV